MEHFNCVIENVVYYNQENGYTIMSVKPDGEKNSITLITNTTNPIPGVTLYVEGEWKKHQTYGKQFVSTLCNEIMPDTVYGIKKYLSSGLIKGVGPSTAEKIVNMFGENTPDIIENHPEKLKEIPRFGEKKINELVKSWKEQKHMFDIMVFLKSFDISTLYAVKIFKLYGNEAINILKDNPYKLITDIDGIGFIKADAIAIKMGYDMTSAKRCQAGIVYTLTQFAEEGNTFTIKTNLSPEVAKLLSLTPSLIEDNIDNMIANKLLIEEEDKIFLPYYYKAEKFIANKLYSILKSYKDKELIEDNQINDIEQHLNIQYNEEQKNAIKIALKNNIMVLTGGPGTGKTTVTKGIITAFRLMNKNILMAAPTGKAADRMSEATGGEAKTIHRLLGYNPTRGYLHNEDFPLDGDILILDEVSMVNVQLMCTLLKAVPIDMKLILIGDVDQLPCIGAGNILSDLIKSNMIPVVKLEKIFRQAASSKIITTAHAINHGEIPKLKNEKDSDLFFISENEENDIVETISDLMKNRLPLKYNIKPTEIQILTPMKKGTLGTKNMNDILQNILNNNQNANEIKYGDTIFRENDKVMQIKNNYDKGVFNGDSGFIKSIDKTTKCVTVIFRKQIVVYDFGELDELMLAYAVTVHKSQGSEYPIIILPLTKAHYMMLKRNLIYTGITRAKSLCILIGQKQTLYMGINNIDTTKRNTNLKEFLMENF